MARKQLNIPRIKKVVMFFVGGGTGLISAISGLGAQTTASPMISFLLGFSQEKTTGTSIAFSLFAAAAAGLGAKWGGVNLDLGLAFLIALGATIGAMLFTKVSADPRFNAIRRLSHALAIMLAVFVIRDALKQRIGGPVLLPIDFIRTNQALGALVVGVVVGGFSQALRLTSGILLIPAIIYAIGKPSREAIGTGLLVVAMAALIPAFSYSSRQLVDRETGPWMTLGGVLGGLSGGLILSRMGDYSPTPMIIFGLVAMFLSAWMLWRAS